MNDLDIGEYNAIMYHDQYGNLSTEAKKAIDIILKAKIGDNRPIDNQEYRKIPLIEKAKAFEFLQSQGEL